MRARWRISIGAVKRAQTLSRSRGGRDFSGGLAKRGRVPRFREGGESAVAREHDRVRQEPASLAAGTGRARLSHGDFSAERVSRFDEGERENFCADLKKSGTQTGWLDEMQTRKELYELLDYDPAAEQVGMVTRADNLFERRSSLECNEK